MFSNIITENNPQPRVRLNEIWLCPYQGAVSIYIFNFCPQQFFLLGPTNF